jgi:hypothetical protein
MDLTTAAAKRTIAIARRAASRYPTVLRVDGAPWEGNSLDCEFHLSAGVFFTADADALRRVLPSPGLHPVRWSPGRTAVAIQVMDWQWRLGSAPPVRSVDAYVAVACTQGPRPAPPVLPILLGSTALGARYGGGLYWLTWLTTNRVSQQVFSRMLGVDAVLVDAQEERGPKRSRFTLTDADRLILDLDVHMDTDTKVTTLGPGELEGYRALGVRDGRLLGWAVTCYDVGSTFRFSPRAADVTFGDHPILDQVRNLDLSDRPIGAGIRISGREVYEGPVPLGPATRKGTATATATSGPGEATNRRLVLSEAPGKEALVNQIPPDLPVDPTGTFTLEPR